MERIQVNNLCSWYVIAECYAKNDGIDTVFYKVVGIFDYPYQAEEFIEKCLPKENRDRFKVVHKDDIDIK